MSGLYTSGMVDSAGVDLGQAVIPVDTNLAQGEGPQSCKMSVSALGLGGTVALTDGATINTNLALGSYFTVTLAGNRTLANPTNPVDGATYRWRITQDGTGNRTLAYGSKFIFPGGAPTASTAAGAIDLITAVYELSTDKYYAVMTKAYA